MTTPPVVSITDELIAELEAECENRVTIELGRSTIRRLLSERAELKLQLAAASVDAERYWWLREKHDEVEGDVWVSAWNSEELCWESLDASCRPEYDGYFDLDAAVDAARSNTTESTTRNEK